MLYNILVGPIEYILQVIFYTCYGLTYNVVISLIGLSLAVSFLTLPLYNQADIFQQIEREKRRSMEFGIKRIRNAFRGDERYWMLSAYYKQQDYKPIYVMRSSLPLLLQIPFFVAAYHFLTNIVAIQDSLFMQSDRWLQIGRYSINVLPILMTGINILSGMIYSKNLKWKEKWQIYMLPFLFLILLYNSPAGLVVYWLCNNVFSLIKNIVIKLNKGKLIKQICLIIGYLLGAVGFMMAVYAGCQTSALEEKNDPSQMILVMLFVIYNLPLIIFMYAREKHITSSFKNFYKSVTFREICVRETILFVFLACYIPIGVIAASPTEFLSFSMKNLQYSFRCVIPVCIGMFFGWFNLIYYFLAEKYRYWMLKVMTCMIFLVMYDHFFWGNDNGILLTNLRYELGIEYSWKLILFSIFCFGLVAILIIWGWKVLEKWENKLMRVILFGLCLVAVFQLGSIAKRLENEKASITKMPSVQEVQDQGVFHFSKEGKNVVIIMLDRAIGAYVPYIMDEKPELMEKFDGFTFYPNAVSTGVSTHICSAELFGGYEYTPVELNKRKEELLKDKQNEALKVLPILFQNNNYKVVLSDLPYANYTLLGDMSIFDEYEHMTAYSLEQIYGQNEVVQEMSRKDQGPAFLEYSFYKVSPLFLQHFVYNRINYNYKKSTFRKEFYDPYQVLDQLEVMTKVEEGNTNYFMEFDNNMTHEPCEWQLPDYTWNVQEPVDNTEYDTSAPKIVNGRTMLLETEIQRNHYQTNVGAFVLLGKWLDFLREQGVYDNTRIIIAADHGKELRQFDDLIVNDLLDVQTFNCLLLYKDFNSKGWHVSDEFMTNADVPTLAVQNLIEDAVNPFTGKKIDSSRKYEGPIEVTLSKKWEILPKSTLDTSDAPWYTVHDNIFIKENWKLMKW